MADKNAPRIGQKINGHTVIMLAFDESDPDDTVPVMLLRKGDPNWGDSEYVIARYFGDREWAHGQYVTTYARAFTLFCERINAPEYERFH